MMGGDLDLGNGQSMAWFGGNAAVYYSAQPKPKTAQQAINEFNATMADLKKHMGLNPNASLSGSTTTDFFTQKPDESLKAFEARMFDFCKNGKAELSGNDKPVDELDRQPDESLKDFEARMFDYLHPGKNGLNSR